MSNASVAGKQAAVSIRSGAMSMEELEVSANSSTTALIGTRIAATALNAVIGMGIGLIISLVSSGIMKLIEYVKEETKPISEKLADVNKELEEIHSNMTDIANDYKELKKSADEVIPRFVKLAEGVNRFGENVSLTDEEYSEFLSLNNKIAEMFPELNMGMDENGNAMLNLSYSADTLTESLNALVEAQREQANQDLVDKMPDLVKDINKKVNLLNQQIGQYEDTIDDYNNIRETFKNGEFTRKTWNSGNASGDWYAMYLKRLGIAYHTETVGERYSHGTKQYQYKFIIDDMDQFNRILDDSVAGVKSQIHNAELQIENAWASLSPSLTAWLKTNSTFDSFSDSLQKIATTMMANVDWSELGLTTQDEITAYVQDNILEPLSKASFATQDAFSQLLEIKPEDFKSIDEYKAAIQSKIQEIADMDTADGLDFDNIYNGLGYDKILAKYDEAVAGIKEAMPGVSTAMIESLAPDDVIEAFNYISAYGISSWDDVISFISTKSVVDDIDVSGIEKLEDALDDLKDTWDDLSDIVEDYNENGYFTADNLKDLMDMEPEYINLLIDENGQINLNNQAYRDYVATKAKTLVLDQVKSLLDSIYNMTLEEAQAYANAEAYDTEADSLINLIGVTYQYYATLARAKDAANNTTAYTDALERSKYTVANYMAVYDSWLNSLTTSQNEFSTSAKTTKEALEDEKDALEDAKDAMEDYKDELEDAQSDIQDLIDLTIDYIKQMKEDEKDALEDQKDAFDDIIDKKKEALELAKEEKETYDEIAEKQSQVAKDTLSLAVASLDDSSAGKKAQKKAQDALASSNKDLQDKLYDNEYDIRVAALEKEKDERDAWYDEQIAKIDEYLNDARKLYEDACAMIDNDNGELYGKLWDYTYTYTTKTRAEFNHLWSSAQTAIQKYKGDNDTLISTMESLQGEIYITETKIDELEKAIDLTSDAIDATSDSIDSVSTSLVGLGSSIADYVSQLQALQDAAGNVDGTNNTLDADFEDRQKRIQNSRDDINTDKKFVWYLRWNGVIYHTNNPVTGTDAAKIFINDLNITDRREKAGVRGSIYHYASGTYSSKGNVAITQENALEAIFGKLSNGQYTLMNEGSHVFDGEATQNLHEFMDNPTGYLARKFGEMNYSSYFDSTYSDSTGALREITENTINNDSGDISLSMPVYIQGDATQSTVNAMKKERENLKNDILNDLTKIRERKRRATIR